MSHRIHVVGATLAGLATSVRLAKVGHQVSLNPAGPLGGRAAPHRLPGHDQIWVDDLEPVLTLPAAWRDLLKKSGRAFGPELTRHHLDLVPAPPAVHHFADGTELTLPDDRAGQLQAMRATLGAGAAQRWTDLLDQVDRLWQVLRMNGVERPFPTDGLDAERHHQLWWSRSLGQLAKDLDDPRLAALLLSAGWRAGATDPHRAPAWLATRWTLPRTFGRWHLATAGQPSTRTPDGQSPTPGAALGMGALVEVLTDRLVERGVELEPDDPQAEVVIDARAPEPPADQRSWWQKLLSRPGLGAVRPPTISHDLHQLSEQGRTAEGLAAPPAGAIAESVFHTDGAPVVAWARRVGEQLLVTSHDHTHPADPDAALGWDLSAGASWLARPQLEPTGPGQPWRASAASHAGNEPWAEVLSAALVTYLVHEQLTGEDIRPTNKANSPAAAARRRRRHAAPDR